VRIDVYTEPSKAIFLVPGRTPFPAFTAPIGDGSPAWRIGSPFPSALHTNNAPSASAGATGWAR